MAGILYPFGYSGQKLTLADIKTRKTWYLLDSEFARRVEWLMTYSAGKLGIGQGWRDPVAADAEFVRRHYIDDVHGTILFNGHKWALRAGYAPCAPADRSYHCPTTPDGRSLAADMVGDLNILHVSGSACGLIDFTYVGGEPWHCQPKEIPHARAKYIAAFHHPLPHFLLPYENPSEEDDDMKSLFIAVEGTTSQYIWTPGSTPVPFVSITQRDKLLLALGLMEADGVTPKPGTTLSAAQFSELH